MNPANKLTKILIALVIAMTMAFGNDCREAREEGGLTRPGPDQAGMEGETDQERQGGQNEGSGADMEKMPVVTARKDPDAITVAFPEDMVEQGMVNKDCGPDTIIWTDPAMPGVSKWRDRRTLVFKPNIKIPFNEGFEVEVVQVETSRGIVRSPEPGAWKFRLKADTFTLRSAELKDVNFQKKKVKIRLAFHSPVSKSSLQKKAELRLDGGRVSGLELIERGRGDEVWIEFPLPRIDRERRLTLTLKQGIESKDGELYTDQTYEREFTLQPKQISIRYVSPNESAKGFYVNVTCDDHSERYYWNRCEIPVESLETMVKVAPPVSASFVNQQRGFRIFGDFRQGDYTITIPAGLTSKNGGILAKTSTHKIKVPKRTPKVNFTNKGRYLPRQRLSAVPVRHLNVSELNVTVRQVPERNLVFWLSGEREPTDLRTSDIIAAKKFEVEHKEDVEVSSWLDLTSLVPKDARGLFEFNLEGGGQSDAVRLVLTRLALVSKRFGPDGSDLWVWVMDAESLMPKSGAAVEVMSISNRTLAKGTADREGLVKFEKLAGPNQETQTAPFAVIAKIGADLTVLRFSDLEVPLSEYPVAGLPYQGDQPYNAAIYMDRGVYRPGETARLVAITWDDTNQAPGQLPVTGRLRDPKGKEVQRLSGMTNPSGMVDFDLDLLDFADTGKYEFVLEVGGKKIAEHGFHVEEFVPERMKAKVSPMLEQGVLMTETAPFHLEARYLFGADAKGERYEAECTLEQGEFSPERQPGFYFGVWRPDPLQPAPLGKVEGELNQGGFDEFRCPAVSEFASVKGPAKLKVMASVFEAGSGRTTVAHSSIPVHPDHFYLGLKSSDKQVKDGRDVSLQGAVVDWDGNPVTETVSVEIEILEVQNEWIWEYDNDLGRSTWRRFLREIEVGAEKLQAKDGKFKYSFKPAGHAEGYIIRASAGDNARTDLYLEGEGYDWWWWDEDYQARADRTPSPMVPDGIAVDVKGALEVGKPMAAVMNLPYPGRLLFTVETDEVLESRWLDIKKPGPFTTTFTIKEFKPNVYVSALLIKDPFFESTEAFIPGRAFGVRSVQVRPSRHEMKLILTVPDEVQPNQELVVKLDTGLQNTKVYATIAAVDEGILQLTKFETPDPLSLMFKKRGLLVNTFETIGWTLLLPPGSGAQTTGGDGDEWEEEPGEAAGRVHPIKPVALWSGLLEVGADGRTEVKFDVPTYRGQLRVMAVAASPSRIASADADVKVRDPLVLQVSFPRFLMSEDVFVVPVFLTNMTGKEGSFEVDLQTSANVKLQDTRVKSINLKPNQSGAVTYVCKSMASYGAAEFDIEARGGGNLSRDHARIPLLPNGPVTQELSIHKISSGDNDLADTLSGWNPQYEQTTVTVTGNRYVKELGHLKYLIRYPYGCIEQTTSTTRPLLFISSLVPSIDPETVKDGSIEEKFMHGVNRLFSMQTSEGGFSYWPGESANTYWGTAYATHVMVDGLEAGYPIDRARVDEALEFMERTLTHSPDRTDPKYGYSVAKSEPYMQFILAKAGRGRPKRVKDLIRNPEPGWGELKEENLFLLKAALYLSGDRTYDDDLKQVPLTISDRRTNGWSFWSALRTKGMMLNIMEDIFPNSPDTELLAQAIADQLKESSHYYTTQELSWCVSGLGKRAAGGARDWSPPVLTLNQETIEPLPKALRSGKESAWQISGASRAKQLLLTVDSIEDGDLFALVRVEGIKPGVSYEIGDKAMKVRRNYRTVKGDLVDMHNIGLGDLVYVELTLTNLTGERTQNVALVDRFGGGLEIENPRLNRDHVAGWVNTDNLWSTSYMNIRDDRIEFFGHLERNKQVTVLYVLRAVIGGRFTTPPVVAEAMYDPRKFSRQEGAAISIKDPWDALTD